MGVASRCGPGDRRAGGYLFETKKAPALQMAPKYYDRNIKYQKTTENIVREYYNCHEEVINESGCSVI